MSKFILCVVLGMFASGCVTTRRTDVEGAKSEPLFGFDPFHVAPQEEDKFEWRAAPGRTHDQMYSDSEGCKVQAWTASQGRANVFEGVYTSCLRVKGHDLVRVTSKVSSQ